MAALITETQADGAAANGRVDEAVRLWLQVVDAYVLLGDPAAAIRPEVQAARLLAEHDRTAEAVAVYRPLLDRLQPGTDAHSAVTGELADLLVTAGDPSAAEQVRRSIR